MTPTRTANPSVGRVSAGDLPPIPEIAPDRGRGWLRRIAPVVVRQRRGFAVGIAAGLVATAASVGVPVVVGRGVDAIVADRPVAPWVLALAGLALVRFAFGFTYRYSLFRAAHHLEADLRKLVFRRLTELSFSFWDRTMSGQVISRANTDIRSIQLLFAFGPLVAMQLLLLVVAVGVMVTISPLLTLVAMAPLPLVFVVGLRLRNRVFPLSWVVQARMADLATIVDENIQGARVVRAFAREEDQLRHLARAARRLRWAGTAQADARARHAPLMEALPRLGLALVLLVGGRLAIDGRVAVGDLVTFNAFVIMLAAPFRLVGFILIQWQRASAAAQRVFEILDERPEITEPARPRALPRPRGRVEFRRVRFAYPSGDGTPVLDGLSFTVDAGETVAIVGRTGSGKSTISRLLPRFYDVDDGAVLVDDIDVRDLALADLRRAVNVVTDDPFLFATSVHANVAYARPHLADDDPGDIVAAALADAAADRFVAELPRGVDTEVGERGALLSGGQRQRLAVARALVADPAVLVLDDATSAIDVAVEALIHEALQRRRRGRTTILIAHRLSTIALADRVLFLADGRLAAAGTHHELLGREPRYAAVLADIGQDEAGPGEPSGEEG
ncbi:MAG: ABC transporter ATP-binding protein [Actinomyces sp.]|nr:MAG: ABC transporter ATP-binding protein [Actinomyces sp.]